MEHALGIGGFFLRAAEPRALAEWYAEKLGIATMAPDESGKPWQQEAGPTVFATFANDTDYFGRREQTWMLNFRVADLDAMLDQLRAGGVTVDDRVDVLDGVGRFGWATDPEGSRFELWEPAAPAETPPGPD